MTATRPPEHPRPTGVSMHDLLASCAAADVISRPPRPERPEGATATAWARPAPTAPHTADGAARHPRIA
ncbi:hypothetical protein [Streptomyces sp. NPDC046727]|uniref:hypothetical protein n=1 Tax=Streptomyces sp. NPDC046727 TaxID=3155373 RepID=UPI0033E839A1